MKGVYERPVYEVTCTQCKKHYTQRRKPVENPVCRKCQKVVLDRNYQNTHKEQVKNYNKKPEVRERKSKADKHYYENNKQVILSKQSVYYQENKDVILKRSEQRRRNRGEKPNGLSGTELVALSVLKELFPQVLIREKDRRTIKNPKTKAYLELDFYIPSLKLAIELNGVTHYKPVYGQEKFERQQRNDRLKRALCKFRGIKLIEIPLEEGVHYDRFDSEHVKLKNTIIRYLKVG